MSLGGGRKFDRGEGAACWEEKSNKGNSESEAGGVVGRWQQSRKLKNSVSDEKRRGQAMEHHVVGDAKRKGCMKEFKSRKNQVAAGNGPVFL